MVLMKKAQTEIMGLMIIVVLIVVIGLFAFRFMLMNQSSSNDEYLSIKANNLINSIKMTSICEKNMGDAIIACCNNQNFCEREACGLVKEEINRIINSSIEENFYFEAKNFEGELCFFIGSCSNGIASSINFLNSDSGNSEIQLKLCRKS